MAPVGQARCREKSVLQSLPRATAVRVCHPSLAAVVGQDIEYGAAVCSDPRLTPSSRNCTLATPRGAEALALIVMLPLTRAPEGGDVMATPPSPPPGKGNCANAASGDIHAQPQTTDRTAVRTSRARDA